MILHRRHGRKKARERNRERERRKKGTKTEKKKEKQRPRLKERVDIWWDKPRLPRYARPGELICTKHRCVLFATILINDRGGRIQPFPPSIN